MSAVQPLPRAETPGLRLLRLSLVAVWLFTAVVSVWELHGQSVQLLSAAGLTTPWLVQGLILGGAAADAALGLAMLCWPGRRVYLAALAVMGLMTLAATLLQASLWLHPLGPLSKNLPIAAILIVLAGATKPTARTSA